MPILIGDSGNNAQKGDIMKAPQANSRAETNAIVKTSGSRLGSAFSRAVHRGAWASILACVGLTATPLPAMAQNFSDKPITLLVGFPAGGSNDMVARIIAPHLGRELGTNVVVEIKAGASGTIAAMATVKAPPDGHTLFASSMSAIVVAPQAFKKPPFDPRKDLRAINLVGLTPQVVSVGPTLPQVKTLGELIALSKTRSLTMASSGTGGLPHLAIELLIDASGAKFTHVPYKGATPAIADTMAGHVDSLMLDAPPIVPLAREGRLRALAVTSAKPLEALPDVPTVAATLPGFDVSTWVGIFAPGKTPPEIIARINTALMRVMARQDVRDQLAKAAFPVATMESTQAFEAFVDSEYRRWGDVLRHAKIDLAD